METKVAYANPIVRDDSMFTIDIRNTIEGFGLNLKNVLDGNYGVKEALIIGKLPLPIIIELIKRKQKFGVWGNVNGVFGK